MSTSKPDFSTVATSIGPYAEGQASLQERASGYEDMLGFLPPRVAARFHVTGALDPQLLELQEHIRDHALSLPCFDNKTTQLLVFAMLMMELSDAARMHAIAARRAGATWEELQGVVSLCYLFRGLSAANRGAELLANLAKDGY